MNPSEKRIEQLQIRLTPSEKRWLTKEAKKAGLDVSTWVKERIFSAQQATFFRLIDELRNGKTRTSALASLNDFLAELEIQDFNTALKDLPQSIVNEQDANYIAAMVEVAAFQKGVHPPKWTMDFKGLDQPLFGTDLQALWPHLLTTSPIPFRRRNIFIDSTIGNRV